MINYDNFSYVNQQRREWANVERFTSHSSVMMARIKDGSMGKFDAYMMVIGKWPEIFEYEEDIVSEKPYLKEFFDIIKQF